MPELVWKDADFAACLEVLPEVDEDRTSYTYRVEQRGLQLELVVYPYSSDVYISLFHVGFATAVFEMRLHDCGTTRYVNDKRGQYLEFAAGQIFGGRYDGESVIPYGVRIFVKPCLAIRLFREVA